MLYGFLGFDPRPNGFSINPRLPEDWPMLEIRGIHFHDAILNVSVARDEIAIMATKAPANPMVIELPPEFARLSYGEPIRLEQDVPLRSMRKE